MTQRTITLCNYPNQLEYDFLKDVENVKNYLRYMMGVDVIDVKYFGKLLRGIVISGELHKVEEVCAMYEEAQRIWQTSNNRFDEENL